MSEPPKPPPLPGQELERDALLDEPGIVGARWWHRSLVAEGKAVQRRQVLTGMAVAGGVVGVLTALGVGVAALVDDSGEKVSLAEKRSLDMQRSYGWDFGARGQGLVFDGRSESPFVRSELEKLAAVMTPRLHGKYQVATLLESLFAQPSATLPKPPDGSAPQDAAPFRPLAEVLVPAVTQGMEQAYRVGEAVSRLLAEVPHAALAVDLPGPESVAFAAGACDLLEPVLLLDNWPHPRGVVASHRTLSALAYYQPRFAEQAGRRAGSPGPLFVLDRGRLAPYSEEGDRFDNRYYARMPALPVLAKEGVGLLFYVVATPKDLPEPADLKDALASAGTSPEVAVRAFALSDFGGSGEGGEGGVAGARMYYGGSPETDESFWVNYPLWTGFRAKEWQTIASSTTKDYRFAQHPAGPAPSAAPQALTGPAPVPSGLAQVGKVAVLVTASGLLVGAALDRRGSMNRFSGGWGG